MDINKVSNLFLTNVYLYDIISCHYRLLESFGYDTSEINREDKEQRNIQIGLLMRDSKELSNRLRSSTNLIVDKFIELNKLKDEEIVIRQYDGLILTRLCNEKVENISPEFRKAFDKFLISIDKTMYIASSKDEIICKGIPHNYLFIESLYSKLLNCNFLSKSTIFQCMENLKNEILFSENPENFCIENSNNKKGVMFIKKYGQIEITKNMSRIMDHTDIDKEKYLKIYLLPFFKSLVKEFV